MYIHFFRVFSLGFNCLKYYIFILIAKLCVKITLMLKKSFCVDFFFTSGELINCELRTEELRTRELLIANVRVANGGIANCERGSCEPKNCELRTEELRINGSVLAMIARN
jgi:hypothetical protein